MDLLQAIYKLVGLFTLYGQSYVFCLSVCVTTSVKAVPGLAGQ